MKKRTFWLILFLVGLFIVAQAKADNNAPCYSQSCRIVSDIPWSNANQTWIFSPVNPGAPVSFQIVNKNTTGAHNLTLNYFVTYNPIVPDRTNNLLYWWTFTSGTCPNGSYTIAASTSLQCEIGNITGAKFAIVISGTGTVAGSPDTFDLYVAQGAPSQRTAQNVLAPVAVKGSTSASPWGTTYSPAGIFFPYTSLTDIGIGKIPAYTPMLANRGQTLVTPLKPVFSQFNTGGSTGNAWWGEAWGINTLPVAIMGVTYSSTTSQGAPGTSTFTFNANGGVPTTNDWWASHGACTFMLNLTAIAGTTPTLNVYVQSSPDNSTWCDMIAFNQATTAPFRRFSSVSDYTASGAEQLCVDAALTAGSSNGGKLLGYVRMKVVLAGAGATQTSTVYASCR